MNERIEGPFVHTPELDGTPTTCNGCGAGHKHGYSFSHAHAIRRSGVLVGWQICNCGAA